MSKMRTELLKVIEIPTYVNLMANAKDDKTIEIYNDRIRIFGTNEYVEWAFENCKGIMLKKDRLNRVQSIKFIMKKGVIKQCCEDRIDYERPDKEHCEVFQQFANGLFSEFEQAFNRYKNR